MSEETMAALRAAAQDDEALRAQLGAATSPNDVVRIAGDAGFAITVEDLRAASGQSGELSLAELDAMAGGYPHEVGFTILNCAY